MGLVGELKLKLKIQHPALAPFTVGNLVLVQYARAGIILMALAVVLPVCITVCTLMPFCFYLFSLGGGRRAW